MAVPLEVDDKEHLSQSERQRCRAADGRLQTPSASPGATFHTRPGRAAAPAGLAPDSQAALSAVSRAEGERLAVATALLPGLVLSCPLPRFPARCRVICSSTGVLCLLLKFHAHSFQDAGFLPRGGPVFCAGRGWAARGTRGHWCSAAGRWPLLRGCLSRVGVGEAFGSSSGWVCWLQSGEMKLIFNSIETSSCILEVYQVLSNQIINSLQSDHHLSILCFSLWKEGKHKSKLCSFMSVSLSHKYLSKE